MYNANAVAIAGGAIAIALIDRLIAKKLLTADEARVILTNAQTRLQPFLDVPDAVEGARIIGGVFQGLPKNGS